MKRDDHPEAAFAEPADIRVLTRCPKGCALGHVIESRWLDPSVPGLLVWKAAPEHAKQRDALAPHVDLDAEIDAQLWDDGAVPVVLTDRLATHGDAAVIVAACARHQKMYEFGVRDLRAKAITARRRPVDAWGIEKR